VATANEHPCPFISLSMGHLSSPARSARNNERISATTPHGQERKKTARNAIVMHAAKVRRYIRNLAILITHPESGSFGTSLLHAWRGHNRSAPHSGAVQPTRPVAEP
jgi:hypothetical protein